MQKNFIYVIFILSINTLFPQISNQEVVAKIGSDEITEEEFLARYELTPQVYAGIKGMEDALKKEILYSLIAEKIWALEAAEVGLSNSDLLKYTYKIYEEMYVRDELYREEILNRVNLSEEYLSEAFRRDSKILQLKYLFSPSELEIDSLYTIITTGNNFDAVLQKRTESKLQFEPYYVYYGQMDKDVEDILFNMNVGEVTKPVDSPNGWYIFKLWKIGENLMLNSDQAEEEKRKVLKIARTTIIDSLTAEFYQNIFSNVNAKTNGILFQKLSEEIIKSLSDRKEKEKENIVNDKEIFLKPEDLYAIEKQLGEKILNSIIIETDDNNYTIKDLMQYFAFETFSVDTIDNSKVKFKLNSAIKKFIEHKLLAQEGYKRGLLFSAEVQDQLKMWRSYYLSNALRNKIKNNIIVTNDELENYYKTNKENSTITMDFDEIKNKLLLELKYQKFNKKIIDKTVKLANKYSLEINESLLEDINVTNTTTVVYRYIGFGGRILAVPMTVPNYEWMKLWNDQKTVSP